MPCQYLFVCMLPQCPSMQPNRNVSRCLNFKCPRQEIRIIDVGKPGSTFAPPTKWILFPRQSVMQHVYKSKCSGLVSTQWRCHTHTYSFTTCTLFSPVVVSNNWHCQWQPPTMWHKQLNHLLEVVSFQADTQDLQACREQALKIVCTCSDGRCTHADCNRDTRRYIKSRLRILWNSLLMKAESYDLCAQIWSSEGDFMGGLLHRNAPG